MRLSLRNYQLAGAKQQRVVGYRTRKRLGMKFVGPRPFVDPDAAARKLVEIANGVEAVQDGRIFIERVNEPFLAAGGSGEQCRTGIARAIALGWRRRFNQVVGAVLWFKRLQTAATTFADVKGFGIRTLLATPFAAQSCWYAVT